MSKPEYPSVWVFVKTPSKVNKKYENAKDVEGGRLRIDFAAEFTDPLVPLPPINPSDIEEISYIGTIDGGATFHYEGVYVHGDARMTLRNREYVVHPYAVGQRTSVQHWQDVRIVAKSFESLRRIYSEVRQGKLQPVENWSSDGVIFRKATAARFQDDAR